MSYTPVQVIGNVFRFIIKTTKTVWNNQYFGWESVSLLGGSNTAEHTLHIFSKVPHQIDLNNNHTDTALITFTEPDSQIWSNILNHPLKSAVHGFKSIAFYLFLSIKEIIELPFLLVKFCWDQKYYFLHTLLPWILRYSAYCIGFVFILSKLLNSTSQTVFYMSLDQGNFLSTGLNYFDPIIWLVKVSNYLSPVSSFFLALFTRGYQLHQYFKFIFLNAISNISRLSGYESKKSLPIPIRCEP